MFPVSITSQLLSSSCIPPNISMLAPIANGKKILSSPYSVYLPAFFIQKEWQNKWHIVMIQIFSLLLMYHDNLLGQQILSQKVCYIWSNNLGKLICTYSQKVTWWGRNFKWLDPLFKFLSVLQFYDYVGRISTMTMTIWCSYWSSTYVTWNW